jgi:hypothetical protein
MDSLFSSPHLFDYLHSKIINCCDTVRPNQKGMPQDFGKRLQLGDIKTWMRGNLITIAWNDERDVNMLVNMHHPPAEGNFCDEHGNSLKPAIVQNYNTHGVCGRR